MSFSWKKLRELIEKTLEPVAERFAQVEAEHAKRTAMLWDGDPAKCFDLIEASHGHLCGPECWHHLCGPLCPVHGSAYLAAMRNRYEERGWDRGYFEPDQPYHPGPGPYWPKTSPAKEPRS